jgi:hypothetical protein
MIQRKVSTSRRRNLGINSHSVNNYLTNVAQSIVRINYEKLFLLQTTQKQEAVITSSKQGPFWHYFASIDSAKSGVISAGFSITVNAKTYTTAYDYSTKLKEKNSEFGTWLSFVLNKEGLNGGNVDDSPSGGLVIFNTKPFVITMRAHNKELEEVLNLKNFYYGSAKIYTV